MPGMFYSLKEAAEKLNATEAQVRQLAREGKLREFRDGATVLFKIDEVEALLLETSAPPAEKIPPAKMSQPAKAAKTAKRQAAPDSSRRPRSAKGYAGGEIAEPVPEPQPEKVPEPDAELEEALEAQPASEPGETPEPEVQFGELPEPQSELDLEELPELEPTTEAPALGEAEEEQPAAQTEPDLGEPAGGGTEEEILLAPEAGSTAAESDITNMDTALTGKGVSVLSEGDSEMPVTEDTMAETIGPAGATTEASLEEIEEDVNLDSFGSGSGLLDLSLQADDTSLGGILDEIYTAEGAEEAKAPAAEAPVPAEVSAEAEPGLGEPEEVLTAPEALPQVSAMAQAYIEPAPDLQSNTFGMLLVLPLVVLLYTAIVTVAAQRDVVPSILKAVQGIIWYVLIGAVVVAGLAVGGVLVKSGGLLAKKTPKAPKEIKPKKDDKKAKKPKKSGQPTQE